MSFFAAEIITNTRIWNSYRCELCDQQMVLPPPRLWSSTVVPLASTDNSSPPQNHNQSCCHCPYWRLRWCCCCDRRQSWTIIVIRCTKDNLYYYSRSHDFCLMVTSSTAKPPSFPLPITACMISVMAKLSCFPCKGFVIFLFCGLMHNLPRIGLVPLSRRQTQDCPGWPQIATTFSFWKCPTLLPSIWRGCQCLVQMQRTRNVRRRSRQTSWTSGSTILPLSLAFH